MLKREMDPGELEKAMSIGPLMGDRTASVIGGIQRDFSLKGPEMAFTPLLGQAPQAPGLS